MDQEPAPPETAISIPLANIPQASRLQYFIKVRLVGNHLPAVFPSRSQTKPALRVASNQVMLVQPCSAQQEDTRRERGEVWEQSAALANHIPSLVSSLCGSVFQTQSSIPLIPLQLHLDDLPEQHPTTRASQRGTYFALARQSTEQDEATCTWTVLPNCLRLRDAYQVNHIGPAELLRGSRL